MTHVGLKSLSLLMSSQLVDYIEFSHSTLFLIVRTLQKMMFSSNPFVYLFFYRYIAQTSKRGCLAVRLS